MGTQAENLVKLVKRKSSVSSKCKVISFVSGKGGVGKTNIAISLAYILANFFSKKVLLLDADIGLGNIHVLLGLNNSKNLKSVFLGKTLQDIVQRTFGFDVILGFSGIETIEELESTDTSNFVFQLEEILSDYDYVLIDNSAGLNRNTISFSRVASTTYVITAPEPTALTDAYAFIKSLYRIYGYGNFKVVVNMCRSTSEGFETFERLKFSCENFLGISPRLASVLPFSKKVKEAVLRKQIVVKEFPSDPFSVGLKKIAQEETGEVLHERKESFISRLIRVFKEGA
ncbi:MAG: MinD/ParA family protein [Desulfurobacteriaceae bacterium]